MTIYYYSVFYFYDIFHFDLIYCYVPNLKTGYMQT